MGLGEGPSGAAQVLELVKDERRIREGSVSVRNPGVVLDHEGRVDKR